MATHVKYDIGTKILFGTCFATKMLFSFCKPMIPVRICTDFCVDSDSATKTIFKILFWYRIQNLRKILLRFAQKSLIFDHSASSYGRNKFCIEFWSQCHTLRLRNNRKSSLLSLPPWGTNSRKCESKNVTFWKVL